MERENVLEVEFIPIWNNNFVWKITKQNEEILKLEEFKDDDLNVYSRVNFDYIKNYNTLYIKGEDTNYYYNCGIYKFCTQEEKKLIEEKVRLINKKYGIIKKWRAKRRERYYYINSMLQIDKDLDYGAIDDDTRYKNNNYFKTEKLAEEFRDKLIEILKDNK